ncbi:acyl-CoA dehydrogenase family protein [Bradyrhizobium sp. CW7]|nr:acyl-CoA dehydrogenase family protein [Bradyrhizobium sp. 156]MCK1354919.1 acyl-CoA dehydrogenase family protein [Bradyrhizobium sp. CW7]MCK1411932.1 acyl-CoA dehydrogenase family protein [Bradyrhizobium sp. CW4]MCK1502116.1 acyl-CoA dehydrogenase family protein [Bradyrhizobium sp. 188]MCK1563550.1 acyl-CoA dehydrogenase family protein [Bradyrhizobium sp. 173]MCK1572074.1 acyl-CoA dehydrogenase family protein [Bradyrhizobium sp. 174]MCK1661427.1 acyl-CoA dehydrogenase family protein [Brady
MLRSETQEQLGFRRGVRIWLEENLPNHLRFLTFRPPPVDGMPWYRKRAERGGNAPHWPKEYGGKAATPVEQVHSTPQISLFVRRP